MLASRGGTRHGHRDQPIHRFEDAIAMVNQHAAGEQVVLQVIGPAGRRLENVTLEPYQEVF